MGGSALSRDGGERGTGEHGNEKGRGERLTLYTIVFPWRKFSGRNTAHDLNNVEVKLVKLSPLYYVLARHL